MKKVFLTTIAILTLASCNQTNIPLERMTELELLAYNDSVAFWDQVYCTNDIRTGSHIRKRTCLTLRQLQDYNQTQIGRLYSLSAGSAIF